MWWLHSEAGYSFHGSAPVAGLTSREVDLLLLGHIIHQEEESAAASGDSSSMHKQKQKIRRGHRAEREDMLRDLGVQ